MKNLFTIIISLFSLSALGQEELSLQAGNSRSDTIDVFNYEINLEIVDFTNKVISGNTKITFAPKMDSVSSISLDLLQLTVDSIKSGGISLTYTYNGLLINALLPAALNTGDTSSVTVYYRGAPKKDASTFGGFYFSGSHAYNIGVGFQADPHNFGRVWFPCFDNFVERSTYTCNITTDLTKKAVCGGMLTDHMIDSAASRQTWSYQLNQEIPTYLASVAVAPYVTMHSNYTGLNGNVPIELSCLAIDTTKLKSSFIHLDEALATYEKGYGPYLWDRVGYVIVPFNAGAMEHATNIAYPKFMVTGDLSYETIMAHELSHHWWGDLVTCETSGDMWINEGMATYSEHLFTEDLYGKAAYLNAVKANQVDVLHYTHIKEGGFRPLYGMPHDYTYGDHVYKKGAYVGHTLRGYLGDSLFFLGIKAFLDSNKFSDVNSYEMRDDLSAITGKDLTSFFDNWVFNGGFPHFSIDSVTVKPAGADFDIAVYIHQKLKGAPAYFSNVPLTLTFMDSTWNRKAVLITVSGEYSQFNFTVPRRPVYVALNLEQKINDAITSESKVIKTTGQHNFSRAFMNVTVNAVTDSLLLRIEHNWVAPDTFKVEEKAFHLSTERYWKLDGISSPGFKATGRIYYDGRALSSYSGTGYFDNALFTEGNEDSLVLMYRKNASDDWNVYPYYTKYPGASLTDKSGYFFIDSLKLGEYSYAMKDASLTVSSERGVKNKALISVYPNPVKDQLTIKCNNAIRPDYSFSLTTISGSEIISGKLLTPESNIDLKNIKAGTYLLKVTNTGVTVHSEKVVVVE